MIELLLYRYIVNFPLSAVGVEDRILDRNGLENLIALPPIEQLLAETVSILKTPIQKTTQLLGSNVQQLSTNLSQYVNDQTPSES